MIFGAIVPKIRKSVYDYLRGVAWNDYSCLNGLHSENRFLPGEKGGEGRLPRMETKGSPYEGDSGHHLFKKG